MKWPCLSVIIPSFNQGAYIERTILSILKQEYEGEVEVIVSDGGSKDETVEILKKYPQIKWWSQPDKGFVDAVMKGISVAKGEILAIQSSDDFYLKDAFKTSIRELVAHSEISIISGCEVCLQSDMKTSFAANLKSYYITPRSLLMVHVIPQHCAFFRKNVIEKINGLREEVDTCADIDLWYRALHFFKGKWIPFYNAVYQIHPNQRTRVLDTWPSSMMRMVESCESDPFYHDKFSFNEEDKKNLYIRWEIYWELVAADLKNEGKEQVLQKINKVLKSTDYTACTKETIYEHAVNYGLIVPLKKSSLMQRTIKSLSDGSYFAKSRKKLGDAFGFSQKVDINWWQ